MHPSAAPVPAPVHVVAGADDALVPVSNRTHLAERIPRSRLPVLDAGRFTWEKASGRLAAVVADWAAPSEQHARNRVS